MHFSNLKKHLLRTTMVAAVCSTLFTMNILADEKDAFVSGTKVNGLGISGMTVDEAKTYMEGFYAASYKLTIKEKNGKQQVIEGQEIGYQASFSEGLQAILDDQNANGRQSGPEVDNSHRLSMTSSYSAEALDAKIQSLNCISGSGITVTADARISGYAAGEPFQVIPEVQGNNVDGAKTAEVIRQAVAAGSSEVNLQESGCYVEVTVRSDDPALVELCNVMNQCREMEITYVFGSQTEVLGGETICTWLTGTENGVISVDRAQAGAYIQTLKDKYDTAGRPRIFQTAAGREVEVTGPYGWTINKEPETDDLIAMIRTGQSQLREPHYTQAAAGRDEGDWGSTYVEIDLTGQHVYVIKDGIVVWDAPCVTGNVAKGHTTPPGVYSVAYKERDRVLRGKKLADGTYEYESPVSYWMPFNGGIGLHDANWRGKFGGTIYQTSGSHGCINLPPAKVAALYEMVYKGMPVICYN